MKESYNVLAFRQQAGSPIQVAFVAHAANLLKWAGIPRKSDELLTGYQRFLDPKRVDEQILPFFQTPSNCSPTALIVALRKDSGMGACVLGDENVEAGKIVQTTLTIEFREEIATTDELFVAALGYISKRLEDAGATDVDSEEDAESADEDTGEADSDDQEEEIHLGSITLARMKELLEDRANWKNRNFRRAIVEFVKPGLLIDGQHRAFGAAKIGSDGLPFVVCGLYDVSWTEQVFQFTVVNLKPKRLPPSIVTAIAGLSLTREEQDQVEQRLTNAGVRMGEVSMMSLVAYDEESPFCEMIDMNVGSREDNANKLGYTAAKRIAAPWYRATRKSLTLIAKELFSSNNQVKSRARWRDERFWYDFFRVFWDAIRIQYSSELWRQSKGNHFFIGASLWALQESILTQVDAQQRKTWKLDEDDVTQAIKKFGCSEIEARSKLLQSPFLESVRECLDYVPEELWTRRWKRQPEDTSNGRKELVTLFSRIIAEGQKADRAFKDWKSIPTWFDA